VEVDDLSGALAVSSFKNQNHRVHSSSLVDDDINMIRHSVSNLLREDSLDGIILVGGTGLSKRDVTVEALSPLFEKIIDGFGELFRLESYKRIGTSAYLSRAIAGVISDKIVYCLPGSKDAVALAMELIMPEIAHTISIARS
jgi:molybdenum cofactor biosynthesis protein B